MTAATKTRTAAPAKTSSQTSDSSRRTALGGIANAKALAQLERVFARESKAHERHGEQAEALVLTGVASALRYLALTLKLWPQRGSGELGESHVAIRTRRFGDVLGGGVELYVGPPEEQWMTVAERSEAKRAADEARAQKLQEIRKRPLPASLTEAQRVARSMIFETNARDTKKVRRG